MEEVDREISEMKLSLNARARIVAESYLTAVSLISITVCCHSIRTCSSMHDPSWDLLVHVLALFEEPHRSLAPSNRHLPYNSNTTCRSLLFIEPQFRLRN